MCSRRHISDNSTAHSSNNEHHQNSQPTTRDCSTSSTDGLHAAGADTLARLVLNNDAVYIGAVRNGQPNGIGTAYMTNGTTYTGNWLYGNVQGQGTLVRVCDGKIESAYIGTFYNGILQGQGQMLLASGHTYNGSWQYSGGATSDIVEEHRYTDVQQSQDEALGTQVATSAPVASNKKKARGSATGTVLQATRAIVTETVSVERITGVQHNTDSIKLSNGATCHSGIQVIPCDNGSNNNSSSSSKVRRFFCYSTKHKSLTR
jgi:hypothetical protein